MERFPAIVYTRPGCPFCTKAKKAMRRHGVPFKEVSVPAGTAVTLPDGRREGFTFPQIFLAVGGSDTMNAWLPGRRLSPVKRRARRAAPGRE